MYWKREREDPIFCEPLLQQLSSQSANGKSARKERRGERERKKEQDNRLFKNKKKTLKTDLLAFMVYLSLSLSLSLSVTLPMHSLSSLSLSLVLSFTSLYNSFSSRFSLVIRFKDLLLLLEHDVDHGIQQQKLQQIIKDRNVLTLSLPLSILINCKRASVYAYGVKGM